METVVAKRILNLKEIAKFMGMHERKIYMLVNKGKLPAFRLGGTWHFDVEVIQEWIKQQMNNNLLTQSQHNHECLTQ
jgi:excisionase family DNA binding protein